MSQSEEILNILINIKDTYIGEISNTIVDLTKSESLGLNIDPIKENELNNILNDIKTLLNNNSSFETFKNITDIDLCKSILYTFYTINLNHVLTNTTDIIVIQEFNSLLLSDNMCGFFISIKGLNLYEFCNSILYKLEKIS
tara:strand:- start:254 stop:676 length:423 start_codon:yes stop_codon:yes gene_type:complete